MPLREKTSYFKFILHFFTACFSTYAIPAASASLSKNWFIQVGAYKNKSNAEKMIRSLKEKTHLKTRIIYRQNGFYVVQIGSYSTEASAKQELIKLERMSFFGFLVSESSLEPRRKYQESKAPQAPAQRKEIPLPPPPPPLTFKMLSKREVFPVFPIMDTLFYGFPYASRGIGEGTWGQQTNFGNGDFMLPLFGNNDWIGYLDGAAKYGDDRAWFGSVGGGIRSAFGNHLWGAYFFADENESSGHKIFWFGNPGIEYMSPTLDIHFNGYIPLSSKTQSFGNFFALTLGLPGTTIVNRTLYEPVYSVENITGPGIDGEIGYTFQDFYSVRPFIGGYHFFSLPNGTHINGVEGGIQIPIGNNIQLLIHDAYDPVQKNTAMGTLRILMGGVAKNQFGNVRDRMMDPIDRHLGAFQTGAGVPILSYNRYVRTESIATNIWFFSPTGSDFTDFSSCTPSNPCNLNQTAIDGINTIAPDANFFFSPGTYNNASTAFNLNNGQSFYGRQTGWLRPAQGDTRALFNEGLVLPGNNTIGSLRIQSASVSGSTVFGIQSLSNATGFININNSDINISGNLPVNNSAIGIVLNSEATINRLQENQITLNVTPSGNPPSLKGITMSGISYLEGNSISVNISNVSTSTTISGLQQNSNGSSTITNTNIALNIQNGGKTASSIDNQGSMSIDNTTLVTYVSNVGAGNNGIYGILNEASSSTQMTNSRIRVISENTPSGVFVVGIGSNTAAPSSLTYQNSSILAASAAGATPVNPGAGIQVTNLGGMTCIQITSSGVIITSCP